MTIVTVGSRAEAEMVADLATDGHRADVPDRWDDQEQVDVYPLRRIAPIASRMRRAHMQVVTRGACTCPGQAPTWRG